MDISTNDFFAPRRPRYFRGSSAAIFAFSKGSRGFLDSATALYHEFKQYIPHPTAPIAFIGLHDDSEVVTLADGQSLAQEFGADYFEIAAADLQSLDAVLKSLVRKVISQKTC